MDPDDLYSSLKVMLQQVRVGDFITSRSTCSYWFTIYVLSICAFGALTLLVGLGGRKGIQPVENLGVVGVGTPLVRLGCRPPGLSVPLPPLSFSAP